MVRYAYTCKLDREAIIRNLALSRGPSLVDSRYTAKWPEALGGKLLGGLRRTQHLKDLARKHIVAHCGGRYLVCLCYVCRTKVYLSGE